MSVLPPTLQQLAKCIGEPAALELANHYFGQRIYIPDRMHENHPIARLLGMEQANDLVRNYGGQSIELPVISTRRIDQRNACIANDSQRMSHAELVKKYRLCRRQIINILNRIEQHANSHQNDLFQEEP